MVVGMGFMLESSITYSLSGQIGVFPVMLYLLI